MENQNLIKDLELQNLLKDGKYCQVVEKLKDKSIDHAIGILGYTALGYSVIFNKIQAINFFLLKGANPFKTNSGGCSPFSLAIERENINLAIKFAEKTLLKEKFKDSWPPITEKFLQYIVKNICLNDVLRQELSVDVKGAMNIFTATEYAYNMAGGDSFEFYNFYKM